MLNAEIRQHILERSSQPQLVKIGLYSWTAFKGPVRIFLDADTRSVSVRSCSVAHYRAREDQAKFVEFNK